MVSYTQMLDYPEKSLPVKNALAYFVASFATKKKCFVMLTPAGQYVIKHFWHVKTKTSP